MSEHRCYFIPPHILEALSASSHVDEETRAFALRDLAHRQEFFHCQEPSHGHAQDGSTAVAHVQDDDSAQQQLAGSHGVAKPALKMQRTVYDSQHQQSQRALPGKKVRGEGEKPVSDKAVNEAYDNVGTVLEMYSKFFNWNSIDNKNMPVKSSVHFGQNYQNAFWDGQRKQMVYGDGGELIYNFTGSIDVIGHELAHAVTSQTSPLIYQGQSGALNEHISDAFGSMIKQWVENETAESADWRIGEQCLVPGVKGVALRSMVAPGTAYDDPRFGKDPQPDSFNDYVVIQEDNGGVHIYSGIPNKAFCLAAKAFGGYTWDSAGKIWWKTMTSGNIPPTCDFKTFANTTVKIAQQEFGDKGAKIVQSAWEAVHVLKPSTELKTPKTGEDSDEAGHQASK